MNSQQTIHQQDRQLLDTKARLGDSWIQRVWSVFKKRYEYFLIPVVVVLFVYVWQLVITISDLPEWILPRPVTVWKTFRAAMAGGYLWFHASYTITEALAGFGLGLLVATVLGYLLGRRPALEKVLSPYIIAAKSVPILGIAPLLIIWFGQGITSKALVAFLIIFFPMLVNTIIGIRTVKEEQRELMRSYSASTWQIFTMLEIPSALPLLLGGMKVGVARSMMGAIVGEYIGSRRGLGFVINMGTGGGAPDQSLTFVGIFAIIIITLLLFGSVAILEKSLLSSRHRETA